MTTLIDQAQTALRAGLSITSTSNTALNGTYDVSIGTQSRISFFTKYLANNSKFPGNQSSVSWNDNAGTAHTFNVVEFQAFSLAVATYTTALQAIIMSNQGTLPSATITIA